MDEIYGKYRQDFSEIRRLCLICHGLDLSTSTLSSESSEWNISETTNIILQNLISSTLLHLAIAIRTNLYQEKIEISDIFQSNSAWIHYDNELIDRPATLKQVCDKIIHASTFSKLKYPKSFPLDGDKIATQLKGKEINNKSWTMNLALDLLSEDILSMLDQIEGKKINNNMNTEN